MRKLDKLIMSTTSDTIITYKLYKSVCGTFTTDFLVLVEIRDDVECTDEYNDNHSYIVKHEHLTPEQANVIYDASKTLEKYGLQGDQVRMKTYEYPFS